jgi:beta-lactam-binding protein with PASTA domain
LHDTVAPARRLRSLVADVLDRDWALALALAFLTAVVVWFGRSINDYFGGSINDVLVPAFSGQTVDDAVDACGRLHLTCSVVARVTSDKYPNNVVVGQQPAPSALVREGRSISLIVSNGVRIFPMPDLRFESLRNAGLVLGNARLHLAGTKMVANDDVPAMHVVEQDPAPLTSIREGSDVHLSLSKGPPGNLTVPNFVNFSIDGARDLAGASKIHLGQIVWTPFGVRGPPRGTVVRQSPPAGRRIDPFEPVSLQVSAGPHEYGYLVRQVHVTVNVPVADDTAQIRLEVRDETGTWNVYDGYAQGGAKLDLNVTAVGTAELDTYVNNELLNSTVLGKEPPTPAPSPPKRGR